jgi:hypothetical protein
MAPPGFLTKYQDALQLKHGHNVHWASSDIAEGAWKSFIDGALESGTRVRFLSLFFLRVRLTRSSRIFPSPLATFYSIEYTGCLQGQRGAQNRVKALPSVDDASPPFFLFLAVLCFSRPLYRWKLVFLQLRSRSQVPREGGASRGKQDTVGENEHKGRRERIENNV